MYKYILYFPPFIFTATYIVCTGNILPLVTRPSSLSNTHIHTHICHLPNGQSYLLSGCLGLSYLPVVCSLCPRMLTDKPEYVCVSASQASVCAFWISHSFAFKGFPHSAGLISVPTGQLLDQPDTLYPEQKGVDKASPMKSVITLTHPQRHSDVHITVVRMRT